MTTSPQPSCGAFAKELSKLSSPLFLNLPSLGWEYQGPEFSYPKPKLLHYPLAPRAEGARDCYLHQPPGLPTFCRLIGASRTQNKVELLSCFTWI